MADRHVIEARKHIADQIRRIRAMERRGEDTTFFRGLLAEMRRSLAVPETHHENILELIARRVGVTVHM
jgi:hypothetical protein